MTTLLAFNYKYVTHSPNSTIIHCAYNPILPI